MGSLKDLYNELAQKPAQPEPRDFARVLDRLLEFLKSDERLPEGIRSLATQTWQWVTAEKLEVVVDPDMEEMTFMHFSIGEFSGASLLLPEDFLELIQEDTTIQLGALVAACQLADNHLNKRRGKAVRTKKQTEAILLHALVKMHAEEGIEHEWNAYQKNLLGCNSQE